MLASNGESAHLSLKATESVDKSETKQHDKHIDPVKNRKRKNNLPNLDRNLDKILKMSGKNRLSFKPHLKSSRGLHNGTSRRRSRFIGVLKNGFRWQVLINVGRTKKYIGTYCEENEAALVHDFYAIGLNATNAKTNFAYNEQSVTAMIHHYYENDCVFDPSQFLHVANQQD